jgi:hypothetical protein
MGMAFVSTFTIILHERNKQENACWSELYTKCREIQGFGAFYLKSDSMYAILALKCASLFLYPTSSSITFMRHSFSKLYRFSQHHDSLWRNVTDNGREVYRDLPHRLASQSFGRCPLFKLLLHCPGTNVPAFKDN